MLLMALGRYEESIKYLENLLYLGEKLHLYVPEQDLYQNLALNYLYLEEPGSKIILSEYDKSLRRTIKHKELGKNVSYRYLIRLECYKLIKHLFEEKEYEPFLMWW